MFFVVLHRLPRNPSSGGILKVFFSGDIVHRGAFGRDATDWMVDRGGSLEGKDRWVFSFSASPQPPPPPTLHGWWTGTLWRFEKDRPSEETHRNEVLLGIHKTSSLNCLIFIMDWLILFAHLIGFYIYKLSHLWRRELS